MDVTGRKRGIVFSGGGQKGQFHVGVAKYLLEDNGEDYQVYGGISVGGLIASVLAQYPKGCEAQAYQDLAKRFDVTTRSIWQHWKPFGPLLSPWKSSLYNSKPFSNLVKSSVSPRSLRGSGKTLLVSATDLETGDLVTFDQTSPDILDAITASASFPIAFSPTLVNGRLMVDGGVRSMTPISACIRAGCTDIDVILCHSTEPDLFLDKNPKTLDILTRTLDLMMSDMVQKDLVAIELYNRLIVADEAAGKAFVNIRVISPDRDPAVDPLKFERKTTKWLRQWGYDCAKEAFER